MPPKMFGEQPRPRVLTYGVDESGVEALSAVFPTVQVSTDLDDIDQSEYDLLVTTWGCQDAEPHLWVVAIGGGYFGPFAPEPAVTRGGQTPGVVASSITRSRELVVPESVDPRLAKLAESDLVPLLTSVDDKYCLSLGWNDQSPFIRSDIHVGDIIQPVLMTSRGDILVGIFERGGGVSQCICLPDGADVARWAFVSTELWHTRAPSRFPSTDLLWQESERWLLKSERDAVDRLDVVAEERSVKMAKFDALEAAARADLERARHESRLGLRALLTEQGDELVAAVGDALQILGFNAVNKDDDWKPMDKLEDLHVTITGEDWISLCEVRGYKKDAQLNDFGRIYTRFVPRFIKRTGSQPSAAWYIVNHSLPIEPGQREEPLGSHEEDVNMYGEADVPGLLVDTVCLFELARDVQFGLVSEGDARSRLRDARGRFEYP